MNAIPCTERMPPNREYVLMWETPSLRWSVGCWYAEFNGWSNRDDPEYCIKPHQVSHWMPLPFTPEQQAQAKSLRDAFQRNTDRPMRA